MTDTPVTSDTAAPVTTTEAPAPDAPASTLLGGAPTSPPAAADASPPTETPVTEAPVDAAAGGDQPVEAKPEDAPAPLVYDLKLPDGVTLDAPALEAFTALATESKLSPEVAQNLLTKHAEALKTSREALVSAAQAQFQETQDAWKGEVKAMPEFATPTAEKQSLQAIGRYMDEFGSPEVRSILDATGAGNNPHIVAMMLKTAKALAEGGPTTAPNAAPPSKRAHNGTLSYPTIPQ